MDGLLKHTPCSSCSYVVWLSQIEPVLVLCECDPHYWRGAWGIVSELDSQIRTATCADKKIISHPVEISLGLSKIYFCQTFFCVCVYMWEGGVDFTLQNNAIIIVILQRTLSGAWLRKIPVTASAWAPAWWRRRASSRPPPPALTSAPSFARWKQTVSSGEPYGLLLLLLTNALLIVLMDGPWQEVPAISSQQKSYLLSQRLSSFVTAWTAPWWR